MINRTIENAQKRVEGHNFDVRKNLLDYDNVMNEQRQLIYEQRTHILENDSVGETVSDMRTDFCNQIVEKFFPKGAEHLYDKEGFLKMLASDFLIKDFNLSVDSQQITADLNKLFEDIYQQKVNHSGKEAIQYFEKVMLLQVIDQKWQEHLTFLEQLRKSIGFRGYANQNPKQEYKKEAFNLFEQMFYDVRFLVTRLLATVTIPTRQEIEQMERVQQDKQQKVQTNQSKSTDTPIKNSQKNWS